MVRVSLEWQLSWPFPHFYLSKNWTKGSSHIFQTLLMTSNVASNCTVCLHNVMHNIMHKFKLHCSAIFLFPHPLYKSGYMLNFQIVCFTFHLWWLVIYKCRGMVNVGTMRNMHTKHNASIQAYISKRDTVSWQFLFWFTGSWGQLIFKNGQLNYPWNEKSATLTRRGETFAGEQVPCHSR